MPASALTHQDLHPKNLLITKHHASIIDWEYSGLGCPYQDLVSLAHFLPTSYYTQWLTLYFAVTPNDTHWYWFNRYLGLRLASSALWALSQAIQYDTTASLPQPISITTLQEAFLENTFKHNCAHSWWQLAASLLDCWQKHEEKKTKNQ